MHRSSRPAHLAFFFIAALYLGGAALGAHAQAMSTTTMVDGTITAISGNTVTLTLATTMQKTVTIQGGTLILSRQAVTLDQIKPGDAMGVASRRASDGSMVAVSINIFAPEMWDGVRKGQFAMTTGDTMTNAVVAQYAKGVQGRLLTMQLADGTTSITVPDGIQIRRLLAVKMAALTVGLHITVRGTVSPDGSLNAATVSFDQPAKG